MRRYIALLLGLQGCGSATRAAPDFSRDSLARQIAEQAVYNAAVAAMITSNRPTKVFVVYSKTRWFGDSTGPAMSQPAWRDFVQQSRDPGVVPPLDGALGADERIGRWEERLKGNVSDTAVIAFSAMGFSPAGDEAVVLMDYRCGTRCGTAAFGWFRRRGEGWILSRADTTSRH